VAESRAASIQRLDVENLGPLGDRTFEFSRLNLFYGPNEVGKTYLVEFLIRSLFRHRVDWALRDEAGQGKVRVGGLADEPVGFTPSSRKKLEDHWSADDRGLPTNMAKLLVVKGAELALDRSSRGGVDRSVLKDVLSSEGLLDRILDPIQATVRGAEVTAGAIAGDNRGELKDRQKLSDEVQRLGELSQQIEQRVSGAHRQSLLLRRDRLESEIDDLERAKRHRAYHLEEQLEKLKAERGKIPDEQLASLNQALHDLSRTRDDLERIEAKRQESEQVAQHFTWVREAVGTWHDQRLSEAAQPSPLWLGAGGLLLVVSLMAALAAALLRQLPMGLVLITGAGSGLLFLLGGVLASVYVLRSRRATSSAAVTEEKQAIEAGYQARFGRNLGGLADLKTRLEELREPYDDIRHYAGRVEELESGIALHSSEIQQSIRNLTGESADEADWSSIYTDLVGKSATIDQRIDDLESELDRLGVDVSDASPEAASVEYSAAALAEKREDLGDVRNSIDAANEDLSNLKAEVIRDTGDAMSAPWEDVLAHFRDKHLQTVAEYRDATAKILAQIGVTQVVNRLKAGEDERIREGLKDEHVGEVLYETTGRYSSVDLVDDRVEVKSDTADYPMEELSTGAREQVLLALRMGLAQRLAGGQSLFLILDDAFQHSDWQRREHLVEYVLRMVDAGWQVTYLTMDDHLRDLIVGAGEKLAADEFKMYELEA
jgi:uncharacterized protein YhaN